MKFGNFQHRPSRNSRQQGYILLILILFVSFLAYATLATAPRVVQQIQREREEEMIHRGAQYARAIRKFVKKNGVYPTSLEQLEDTNQVRYLRRQYKEPFAADGKWRVLRITDVPSMSARQATVSGQQGDRGAQQGQPGSILGGQQGGLGQQGGILGGSGPLGQPMGGQGLTGQGIGQLGQSPGGLGQPIGGGILGGSQGAGRGSQPAGGQQGAQGRGRGGDAAAATGGLSSQPSSQQGLSFGGGAILGVASVNEREGLKEFDGKSKYKEWYFVYDPAAEATNPNGGGALIIGPYTGRTYGGAASGGIGTPAGQLASPNQPSGFGQPISSGFSGTSPANSTSPTGSSGSSPQRR